MADDPQVDPLSTPTANYGWLKPTVGADNDAWGGMLNGDLDNIDTTVKSVSNAIPLASSTTPTMDGAGAAGAAATFARADHVHPTDTSRYAASNPSGYQTAAQVTAALPVAASSAPLMDGAAAVGASAAYARADHVHPTDTSLYPASNPSGFQTASQVSAALPQASSTTPAMDGTAAPGSETKWARGDHVHPTDTTRYAASNPSGFQTAAQVTASLGAYLPLAGGSMTGLLTLSGDPSPANGLGAATKQYADTKLPLAGGTMTGALTPSQTAGLVGTTTNNNAAAGAFGEYQIATQASNVSLVNSTAKNVTSLSLTAGDWDVHGQIEISPSVGSTNVCGAVTLTSGVYPSSLTLGRAETAAPTIYFWASPLGPLRVSLAATTTVYLVASADFSTGTCAAQGIIRARRVR